MPDYLIKTVGNKKWIWFKNTNNYLQIEEEVYHVFEQLQQMNSVNEVINWCSEQYGLSQVKARNTVLQIEALFSEQLKEKIIVENEELNAEVTLSFYSAKYYRFHNAVFHFFYGTAELETMFHPLFAHLETNTNISEAHNIKLFIKEDAYFLNIDGNPTQSWLQNEDHLFKGQVFMEILNQAYSKKEEDWMGILHASAIGKDKNSVLFLGDSGNGKSTASAIALASGLALVADDFVPIDSGGRVLAFPAAISVKKQALSFLSKQFPELLKAKEYELKEMNKTVRYLAPKISPNSASHKVKGLVFIQYSADIDFDFEVMDKHLAFQHLVVDSWLSPKEENARFFMDWMADLPAYRLRYSNNEKMIEKINELLSDDK
ncbi:MAG: hypothetical protein J7J72_09605 [Bacteroidales bacterium]|nr:hypothetical protein [Bacteroidales bacterium]